jgi:phage tail-like protein
VGTGSDKAATGHYAWTLTGLKGAESDLTFFQATLPNGSVDVGNVKVWGSQNGAPIPMQGGGHQASWQPITLTRYLDDSTALWDWYASVMEKGAVDDTKDNPVLTCYNNDQALFHWTITGAVPTSYSHSEANAQTQGLMTETITLTYEEAKLER